MAGKKTTDTLDFDRVREETTTNASTGAGRARAAGGGGDGRKSEKAKDPRGRKPGPFPMYAINVRFPEVMAPLVAQCIEESPVEFGSMADFIRRAVENELRRRGKIKKFAED